MEVFMSNLPPHLSDAQLKRELTPLVKDLGIQDWTCDKQRKKPHGNVTFLRPEDGAKFLRQHGEQDSGLLTLKGPRMIARLYILNTRVYCKPSKRQADPFVLRSIRKDAEDRHESKQQPEEPKDFDVAFAAQRLSCGYFGYNSERQLAYSPEVQWQLLAGVAKFTRYQLTVTFDGPEGAMKVDFPYRTINAILSCNNPTSLTLTLWEPPRFYVTTPVEDLTAAMGAFGLGRPIQGPQRTTRERLTELPHGTANHSEVVGQCLVYRLHLHAGDFHAKLRKLRLKDTLPLSSYDFPGRPLPNPSFIDGMKAFNQTIPTLLAPLGFDVLFQLQGLVQNGYLLPWTGREILIRLYRLHEKNKQASRPGKNEGPAEKHRISGMAIKKLFSQIPFAAPDVEATTFEIDEIMQYLNENETQIRQGLSKDLISEKARNNLTMVYKVQVTPTSVSLHGPEAEAKNRILRKFPGHTEYFVRVQFCDEDGQDIFFNPRISNEEVYDRFLQFLSGGTLIGGRKYEFLGFSHSSLRSHAAWFMAAFWHGASLNTYFTVINDLGSFKDIYSPARCAARIGQAFSETPFAVPLEENEIKDYPVPDIWSKEKRIFTDGVGTISPDALEIFQSYLPGNKSDTCFQIRWGGAKGMLALDATLTGKVVRFRPSMVKFASKDIANLEICDVANKPIPLKLNRQMIKILEDMAVPDKWFLDQQDKELVRLKRITSTIFNTTAFLKRQKIADQIGLARMIRRLDQLGIDYRNDRFLSSVVEAVILRELRLLKHKARIPVDEGVTLFGIADESGFLREGEIYITFEKSAIVDGSYLDLHEREMIVTRSPALHPGDIQLATNKIPPDGHPLRQLRNCIVFSQRGKRDLPSQLSGGDLDGDIYNIIWDQVAVDNCKYIFAPADYPLVKPLELNREVRREDMTAFFIQFMKTDNLGLIAVKHMIMADQRDAGTVDQECQLLAQLHSTGVDYSKTGVPVDLNVLRGIKNNPHRPDFLAPAPPTHLQNRTEIMFEAPTRPSADEEDDEDSGPRYKYYRSDKILGQLYRAINEQKIWDEEVHVKPSHTDGPSIWDTYLTHVLKECDDRLGGVSWTKYLEEAQKIRHTYDDTITAACVEYSEHASMSITELEVFTGNIFNKSGAQTRRQRDRSLKLKDEFDRIARWIESVIRKRPIVGVGDLQDEYELDPMPANINGESSSSSALELSIACLHVGCKGQQRNSKSSWGRQSDGDHQSFKVVAACCVVKELDLALRQAEIQAGAVIMGGGFPGVNGKQS